MAKLKMVKCTLSLTEKDAENASEIHRATSSRSKAHAVAIALALTRFIIDTLKSEPGSYIIFRKPDGSSERLVMSELENLK